MYQLQETRKLPFSAEQMYDLVADIGKYHEFLPWCIASRITKKEALNKQGQELLLADLVIGYQVIREKFTSKVTLTPKSEIKVVHAKGPFKTMQNHWRFVPVDDHNCELYFYVEFEFSSFLLNKIMGLFFEEASRTMILAFEERAKQTYRA